MSQIVHGHSLVQLCDTGLEGSRRESGSPDAEPGELLVANAGSMVLEGLVDERQSGRGRSDLEGTVVGTSAGGHAGDAVPVEERLNGGYAVSVTGVQFGHEKVVEREHG